jgi:hypothetical protein
MSSLPPPQRPMLTRTPNIVSSEIKKCSLQPREFGETDIQKFIELKSILDNPTKTDIEKKEYLKNFIENNSSVLYTPRPSLNSRTIMHILAIGSIKESLNWLTYHLLSLASYKNSALSPDNLDKLIKQIISLLENTGSDFINNKNPNINCMDGDNKTPLDYACNKNTRMKSVLEYDNYCNKSIVKGGKKVKRKNNTKKKKAV